MKHSKAGLELIEAVKEVLDSLLKGKSMKPLSWRAIYKEENSADKMPKKSVKKWKKKARQAAKKDIKKSQKD